MTGAVSVVAASNVSVEGDGENEELTELYGDFLEEQRQEVGVDDSREYLPTNESADTESGKPATRRRVVQLARQR